MRYPSPESGMTFLSHFMTPFFMQGDFLSCADPKELREYNMIKRFQDFLPKISTKSKISSLWTFGLIQKQSKKITFWFYTDMTFFIQTTPKKEKSLTGLKLWRPFWTSFVFSRRGISVRKISTSHSSKHKNKYEIRYSIWKLQFHFFLAIP